MPTIALRALEEIIEMKCLTFLTCMMAVAVAIGPVEAQVTPSTPPVRPRAETAPRPARAPRAVQSFQWHSDDELHADLEQRQRAMQDAQVERQQELEQRQQELQELQLDRQRELPESFDGAFLNRRPPVPWAQGDPADSLYRVAREALNRGDYRRAAQLFNDLTRRYPQSNYANVSTYYEAFSRYRIGTTEELMAADRALRGIAEGWSSSSSRSWGRSDNADVEGLRTRIRGALAMRGDDRAADDVERRARQAGSSCDQEDLMVRIEALNALSQMDAAAAMPILKRVLERREDCLVELRRRAIFMLARRGDADATSVLISAAKNDPSPTVRAEAVSYLPRMAGDAGLAALEDVLRTSDDERIQRAAVRALMSSDSPAARTSLRGLLERRDASETLRMQVIEAYTKERSTPDDAAYLRSLYRSSDSERVKMAIIGAIARIGGKDNQDWLTGIVRNTSESSQIRSAALQRLSRSDLPVNDIGRLYDAADSRSMREQLLSALASRKEPEATDKLIEIARNSTDLEMRRMAINYLSRKNDPRATKLLMELIEK